MSHDKIVVEAGETKMINFLEQEHGFDVLGQPYGDVLTSRMHAFRVAQWRESIDPSPFLSYLFPVIASVIYFTNL